MLWDCEFCGCRSIAASLDLCPACYGIRPGTGSVLVFEEAVASEADHAEDDEHGSE